MKDSPALCPSGRCEPGAKLLGLVQEDGTIGYLGEPLEIDSEFVERASKRGTPERRFRFVNPCAECGCRQWTGTRCGVIDGTIPELTGSETETLPRCGIRPRCRWFRQSGAAACRICSLVVTETREHARVTEQP